MRNVNLLVGKSFSHVPDNNAHRGREIPRTKAPLRFLPKSKATQMNEMPTWLLDSSDEVECTFGPSADVRKYFACTRYPDHR